MKLRYFLVLIGTVPNIFRKQISNSIMFLSDTCVILKIEVKSTSFSSIMQLSKTPIMLILSLLYISNLVLNGKYFKDKDKVKKIFIRIGMRYAKREQIKTDGID